jgi:CO/xanthine dehydrogenase Mo-binding subunit
MRKAGASARAMLIEAAAATWRVDPGTCRTANGEVIHEPSGRRLAYGALVERAARLTPPKDPVLKARKDFKLIGTPARRLDSPDKVNGRAMFGIDAMPPGVRFANLRASPLFGGKVAHVEVDRNGDVKIRRVVCAVDCGIAVNPDMIAAQIEGGLIFGFTAALYSQITNAKGRVQQKNFNDYRMMRINEAPAIEVHLIPSEEAPGGIGESGTVAAAPSLANALFAATGVRLRHLPINRDALAGKKPA